jgi:hypothetical protein
MGISFSGQKRRAIALTETVLVCSYEGDGLTRKIRVGPVRVRDEQELLRRLVCKGASW